MADASPALRDATQVKDIGFAEFTADLVLKVFNGLVAANLSQTEAYIQLIQAVSKSLKDYVNDTHDDIGPDQLLAFLSAALPKDASTGEPKQIKDGTKLDAVEAAALNNSLELATTDGGLGTDNKVATIDTLNQPGVDTILKAVALRIAANKYDLLKEMVKQGLLRLVVTNGIIETKLVFSTYSSTFYLKNTSSYERKQFNFAANAKTGGALSKWVSASASANYSSLAIRTTNETQANSTSTQINIFGLVHLEFKTDYLPLLNA